MATHGEAETRRAGATAPPGPPRQDEGEIGDGGDADGGEAIGEAAGDRKERWSVALSLLSGLSCRSGEKECRVGGD
eukprot:322220-Prymnesium_polylepis.1